MERKRSKGGREGSVMFLVLLLLIIKLVQGDELITPSSPRTPLSHPIHSSPAQNHRARDICPGICKHKCRKETRKLRGCMKSCVLLCIRDILGRSSWLWYEICSILISFTFFSFCSSRSIQSMKMHVYMSISLYHKFPYIWKHACFSVLCSFLISSRYCKRRLTYNLPIATLGLYVIVLLVRNMGT